MRIQKILVSTPVLFAAVLVLGACTERVEGTPLAMPGVESTTDSARTAEDEPGSRGSDTEAQLSPSAGDVEPDDADGIGPGGAPWDPCRVITWEDMPEEKPASPKQAQPVPVEPSSSNDRFNAACEFLGQYNGISVLWGSSSRAVVEPPDAQGEQQITVAGRTALQTVSIDEKARLLCLIQVDLGDDRGVVGVGALARAQAPEGDRHPSVVAKRLTELVVQRTTG